MMKRKILKSRKAAGKAAKKIKREIDATAASSTTASSDSSDAVLTDASDVFQVEEILNKRIFRGKVQYLITWEVSYAKVSLDRE